MAINIKNKMALHWIWQRLNFGAGVVLLVLAWGFRHYDAMPFLYGTCFATALLLLIEHYRLEIRVVITDYYVNNARVLKVLQILSNSGFWLMSLAVILGYLFFLLTFFQS